ncbi:hypothetical protein HPB49_024092 [Dermacentor silvarum]|uniref:Uncharacterized protein n=1 Tax=Dermacentor silvarum TaxID=543639 RepID=A0ACB8CI74_DERSI|nr:hypothetical protein HPB49_024092 [Dermacentor silvarum]
MKMCRTTFLSGSFREGYRLAGPTSYGYSDWHRGPSGALWLAQVPDDEIRVTLACSGIEFVPRYAWGGRPPKLWERLKVQPVPRVFVHHTAGGECFDPRTCSEWMRYIQHFHMDARGWNDIGYSFLIGGDGRVYVARGWGRSRRPHQAAQRRGTGSGLLRRLLASPADSPGNQDTRQAPAVRRRLGWEDIAYSFIIGGDGRVYVARGWDAIGAHTKGHNKDALSMAFFGDFSRRLPTPRAMRTLDRLLHCGVALGKIRPDYTLHGHRDATCTISPGDTLYAFISRWRHFRGRLQTYIC